MTYTQAPTWLDLYDWRRRVARMWQEREAALRAGEPAPAVWQRFCAQKDALFRDHPQTPLTAAQRRTFAGLAYFPYNPNLQIEAVLRPAPAGAADPPAARGGTMPLRPAAHLDFTLAGTSHRLTVYWIDVYGGGLFLPFRDTTGAAEETYGGGRYLFDTVKGSDFLRLDEEGALDSHTSSGYAGGRVRLDFNYAYNPSCAYDARWVCPLAPRENWLPIPIRAGERRFAY